MLKRLFATTALAATLVVPAMAAETTDAMKENMTVFERDIETPTMADDNGFYAADAKHLLASNLIGSYIYNGTGDDAEAIGDVNDVVMSRSGDVLAVIAGIGGFLGIGEKEVAISIDNLSWKTGEDGERWLVGEMTRETLEGAPEFDRNVIEGTQTAENAYGTDGKAVDAEPREVAAETDQDVDPMVTAATDRDFAPITDTTLSADRLIGMNVIGANGEDIGEVGDIIIGPDQGIEAIILDVGGFLGLGEKPVAVSMDNLMISRADGAWDWSTIRTQLTEEQLEGQEAYSETRYREDPDTVRMTAPAFK